MLARIIDPLALTLVFHQSFLSPIAIYNFFQVQLLNVRVNDFCIFSVNGTQAF